MGKPDPRQLFGATIRLLDQAQCPECGRRHDEGGYHTHCPWCADRALLLELYEAWHTIDRKTNGAALARRAARIARGDVKLYQIREFHMFVQ